MSEQPASRINDFAFKIGTVNGTGSASANSLLMQAIFRMGIPVINRTHPDFPALQVLNTVLGGYFGSRLMANIREDKGYTYGIGSGMTSLKQSGSLFIATEVGADVCAAQVDAGAFGSHVHRLGRGSDFQVEVIGGGRIESHRQIPRVRWRKSGLVHG